MHPIKIYRKRHNMNRATFAAWMRVSYEAVRLWEKRRTQPAPKMAMKIEKLTKGEIGRYELRPDLWSSGDTKAA